MIFNYFDNIYNNFIFLGQTSILTFILNNILYLVFHNYYQEEEEEVLVNNIY